MKNIFSKLFLFVYTIIVVLFSGDNYSFAQTDLEKALDELLMGNSKSKTSIKDDDLAPLEKRIRRDPSVAFDDDKKEKSGLRLPSLSREDSISIEDWLDKDSDLNEAEAKYADTRDLRPDRRENLRNRNERSAGTLSERHVSSTGGVRQDNVRKR
jgi:hypothetical protein